MNLLDFLRELEGFYPLNESEEKINKRLSSYVSILEKEITKRNKKYDFEKVLRNIQMSYKYKSFPSLPDILEFLNIGELKNVQHVQGEGSLAVITLPNGAIYPFEIAPFGNEIEEIKKRISRVYGNYQLRTYPKGSVMIGTEIVTP